MLNRTAGNLDAALANAEQILAVEPNHILGLSEAAQAAIELGRVDDAAAYYVRLVEAYPQESTRPLPEYEGHSGILGVSRTEAEAFLAAR
jgi:tetratricopeptide (TPR) repeat protein